MRGTKIIWPGVVLKSWTRRRHRVRIIVVSDVEKLWAAKSTMQDEKSFRTIRNGHVITGRAMCRYACTWLFNRAYTRTAVTSGNTFEQVCSLANTCSLAYMQIDIMSLAALTIGTAVYYCRVSPATTENTHNPFRRALRTTVTTTRSCCNPPIIFCRMMRPPFKRYGRENN